MITTYKSCILALLFAVLPISPLLAQESNKEPTTLEHVAEASQILDEQTSKPTEENTTSDSESTSEDIDVSNEEALEDDESIEETTAESSQSRSSAQSETEVQALGKYLAPTISETNGSLNYEYPIVVPPGRNGLSPDISLIYTSSSKSQSSIIGTGWSLNVPYIQRMNKKGTDKLYTEDNFISSIDGELMDQGSGVFTPRTENGSFLKYEYDGTVWTITDKTGTTYEFGSTTQARQDDPSDSTKVYSWMLETVTDTNGNEINYTYFKDQGQIYPDTISYASGFFDIAFNRTPRIPSHTAYSSAFPVTTAHLIHEIEITTDGSVTATYDITTSDNLVDDITITGREGTSSVSLPPTTLDYTHEGDVIDFNHDTSFAIEEDRQYGVRFGDVNGDSLPDFIVNYRQTNGTNLRYLKLNTGSGWQTASWTFPSDYQFIFYDYNGQKPGLGDIVDVNGDGLMDLVWKDDRKRKDWKFYINNGSGWALDTTWEVSDRYPHGSRFADVNGDSLPDIATSYWRSGSHIRELKLNTGSGWETASFSTPNVWQLVFYDYSSQQTKDAQLIDVNADGLTDLLLPDDSDDWEFYINEGDEWVLDTTWALDYSYPRGTKFGDVNGDNLPDLITSFYNGSIITEGVHLNNGSGWDTYQSLNLPNLWPEIFYDYSQEEYRDGDVVDINGDGITDFVFKSGNDDWKFYPNDAKRFGDIETLVNTEGGETNFTYTTAFTQDSSNEVPFPIHVVASVTTDDQNGNVDTTSYNYSDADYYFGDPHDKRFTGFGEVVKTNPNGSIETTKYHQNNGETGNEPTDSYAKIGKAYEETIEDSSNDLYSRMRKNYTETNLGGISSSILVASQLTQQYDGTSSHTDTATDFSYDSYGNLLTETRYGEVSGNSDGTFTDTDNDKRSIEYTYTNDTINYIVGLPTNQALKNNSGATVAETDFTYDTDGNLLTESQWISGSNYADTTYTYNSFGLPLTQTDPLSNMTTYVYDTNNLYPETITNAENHVTTYSYDYSSGKPSQVTEPNGKVTQYDYDGLDRIIEVEGTFENGGTTVLEATNYVTASSPQYTTTTVHRASGESQDTFDYVDGFGKTIQTKSEMDSGWATIDTIYDETGRISKQSLPYETTSSVNSSPTTDTNLLTEFTYDILDRVLSVTNARGTTTTNYDGFETTITDAENNEKSLVTDAFGNLIQVQEHNGASVYTTDYEYNAQDLLTKITDEENNVRDIDYDGLGRRTSLEDLHASADTTFGVWNFTYNDINLTSQSDPNGTTTSFTYDDINRVLTEDNSSTTGTDITYIYDSCSSGDGYLCSASTPNATTSYTYLKQGLVDTETVAIDAVNYTSNYDYNRQGDLTKVTHPNASYTEYDYNTRGLVDDVSFNGTSLVTANYGVHGNPSAVIHANGVASTITYNANGVYELANKTTTDGTTDFQDVTYTYDNVGNITQIVDASDTDTARTQTFMYDDLYRLTGTSVTNAANGNNYSRSYAYSPIGNITSFDGIAYTYNGATFANPHAVTSVGGQSYTYDNNGNLTSDGTWTHSWNYDNTLSSSTDGTNTSSYEYNHENQRAKLVEGTDTTLYPSAEYEVINGNSKVYLSLGDMLVATDDNGTLNHIHTDHLGGTNITTDTTGVITQTLDYYPFGDTRIDIGTDSESKQYTGYVKDASTGLHYAGARYYGNDTGRFISQDPVSLTLGDVNLLTAKTQTFFDFYLKNPQTQNSYSYGVNNPLRYIDKDGEFILDALEGLFTPSIAYAPSPETDLSALPASSPYAGANGLKNIGLIALPGAFGSLKYADEVVDASKAIDGKTDEFSEWLNRGETNTKVYKGVKDGEEIYTGITKNLNQRSVQHGDRFDNLTDIAPAKSFTRNQARSIEQASILNNPGFTNKINSINPERGIYKDAVKWGQQTLSKLRNKVKIKTRK